MTTARWRTLVGLAILGLVWFSAMYRFDLVRGDQYATWRLDRWTGAVERLRVGGLPAPWAPAHAGAIIASVGLLAVLALGVKWAARKREVWARWFAWSRTVRAILIYASLTVMVGVVVFLLVTLRARDQRLAAIQGACVSFTRAVETASRQANSGHTPTLMDGRFAFDALVCRTALTPDLPLDLSGVPPAGDKR
jgi:hypothetical protein